MQDDSHLFLVDNIARCLHVGLRVAEVDRSIYSLDGIAQHAQHLVLVVQIGNHIGVVDTGEGLVVRVFQQRGRTDGKGRLHHIEEGKEVLHQAVGQLGFEEVAQDDVIVGIGQGYLIQIVGIHKLIEHIGAEHDGLGDGDTGILKLFELRMMLHQIVDESQSAPLASQRTVANTGKVGVSVEAVAPEDCHHSLVFHLTVFHDSLEDDSAVGIHVLQAVPGDGLQELCHGEHGTRVEPAADVVAADVVKERFCRNGKKNVLQLFEVLYAGNLFQRVRVAEDEVAEAEIV